MDVAVVGGGILGCMVAREVLARTPGASVAVLERGTVGGGAGLRSAGVHFPRGRAPEIRAWARDSEDHSARGAALESGLPIRPLPMAVLAAVTGPDELAEHYLGRLRPCADVPPPLRTLPAGASAWWVHGAQRADVAALSRHVAAGLRAGATVDEGVEVTALDPGDDGVGLTTGTGGLLRAGRAVLAVGPWITGPGRDLIGPLGTRVKKVVALHVDLPAAPGDAAVVLHDEDAFLLPLPEAGHWLFSFTRHEWDVDPETLTGALSAADLEEGRAVLRAWAPDLADRARSGRVFCDAYGADGPEVRRVAPRVVFAGGASGSGYRLAPAMAARAVDLLTEPPARGGHQS